MGTNFAVYDCGDLYGSGGFVGVEFSKVSDKPAVCPECGRPPDFRGMHKHHIKPKGMGGSKERDVEANIQWLCARCHAAKHGIREKDSRPEWSRRGVSK